MTNFEPLSYPVRAPSKTYACNVPGQGLEITISHIPAGLRAADWATPAAVRLV